MYIKLGEDICAHSLNYMMIDEASSDNKLKPDERDEVIKLLIRIQAHCKILDLPVTAALVEKAIEDTPQTRREFDQYNTAMEAELKKKLFLFVPAHEADFFDKSVSIHGFPIASAELSRANNCYALSEPTACVFHAMRAAEIALRALATALAVTTPTETAQWQHLIERIESTVSKLSQQPRTHDRTEDQSFYSAAAAQFRYLKDAWRNHVSHAKVTYSASQALDILKHSTDLIGSLSPRLSE